ncbi:uncharacterized protein LOC123198935 [Mangifera indica]|uniref:uncharacterized protein LOC123198935 n=1 Tax=Mangifera indica TaxID=29780 RepID=UPI001CFBF8B0|nr:uncharacterized protein LOC123198935 [Mangifera indica]
MGLSVSGAIKLFNGYEARVMILLSLSLQIILIIFGSRRKFAKTYWINLLVWLTYLAADLVATAALGILSHGVGSDNKSSKEIQAFWAPFLLLHLGGPDTITAYSLEDNELWFRHLLGLVFQVGVAFYIFVQYWTSNVLTFIGISMFITGIIKYGERTLVLRSSSAEQLTDLNSSGIGDLLCGFPKKNDLENAYFLFERFRYLFAGFILDRVDGIISYRIFYGKCTQQAFTLLEIELGFMFDVLYSKASILYTKFGMVLRCICLFSHISILVVFQTMIHKSVYPPIDVFITYALIFGAIALEAYAFIIIVFSDWTKLWMINHCHISNDSCFNGLLCRNRKRWSRSMRQYNLLSSCLKDISTPCIGFQKFHFIKKVLHKYWYLTWEDINDELQNMIFEQLLKKRSELEAEGFDVKLCKKILARRGDNCLEKLRWSTIDVDFDHSLLLWHIATDICYHVDLDHEEANKLPQARKISKYLSDYMLYLLVVCPDMLPRGIRDISYKLRYKETYATTMEFFEKQGLGKSTSRRFARQKLFLKGIYKDKPQSMLCDGWRLAKQLQSLETTDNMSKEIKWQMIRDVWMEILLYAASRCGWKEHGQRLMEGGEFLTHLSLLMVHLGLSEQYT